MTAEQTNTDRIRAILSHPDARDEHHFATLHRHFVGQLVDYATMRGARDPEAMANLAMFEGFRALRREPMTSASAFRAYVNRVVWSRTVDERRRLRLDVTPLEEEVEVWPDHAYDLVDTLWLRSIIAELPVDQRVVLVGRYFHGKTAKELGRELGKAPNAIYQLQFRALRRLRRLIEQAPPADGADEPHGPDGLSDVEDVGVDEAGVLDDVLAARGDVVAHEYVEQPGRLRGLFTVGHGHPLEHAGLAVEGGLG